MVIAVATLSYNLEGGGGKRFLFRHLFYRNAIQWTIKVRQRLLWFTVVSCMYETFNN